MLDFKKLKRACAQCGSLDYYKCRECRTYKLLNQPCSFCGALGAVPLTKTTRKGLRRFNVCRKCLEILT